MDDNSLEKDKYFADYENLEVHALMLRDRPRQEAYRRAITNQLFKNKVVLDVGAGTGILSAFCAKAGAKLVYAVEATETAKIALNVIKENNLTAIVKVVQCKIEEFKLPPNIDKVDIIVSEWMGFYLLHEGMLDSVIYARDHFLKKDGLMFPTTASISMAPCAVPQCFEEWHDVDGISMKTFAEYLRVQKSTRPEIVTVKPEDLLHPGRIVHWIDLQEVQSNELDNICINEVLTVERPGRHQGFCIWFDCSFPTDDNNGTIESVHLSTSPMDPITHWKQCVVVLPEQACEDLEAQMPIAFKMTMLRSPADQRKYNLEVELIDPNEVEHPLPCDCMLTKCILTKAHLFSLGSDEKMN